MNNFYQKRKDLLVAISLSFSLLILILVFSLQKISLNDSIQIFIMLATFLAIFFNSLRKWIFPPFINPQIGKASILGEFMRLEVENKGPFSIKCHARIESIKYPDGNVIHDPLNLGWDHTHERERLIFSGTSEYVDLICLVSEYHQDNIVKNFIGYYPKGKDEISRDFRPFSEGCLITLYFFMDDQISQFSIEFKSGAMRIYEDQESGKSLLELVDPKKIIIKRIY